MLSQKTHPLFAWRDQRSPLKGYTFMAPLSHCPHAVQQWHLFGLALVEEIGEEDSDTEVHGLDGLPLSDIESELFAEDDGANDQDMIAALAVAPAEPDASSQQQTQELGQSQVPGSPQPLPAELAAAKQLGEPATNSSPPSQGKVVCEKGWVVDPCAVDTLPFEWHSPSNVQAKPVSNTSPPNASPPNAPPPRHHVAPSSSAPISLLEMDARIAFLRQQLQLPDEGIPRETAGVDLIESSQEDFLINPDADFADHLADCGPVHSCLPPPPSPLAPAPSQPSPTHPDASMNQPTATPAHAPMRKPTATPPDTAHNGPAHSCEPPPTRKQPESRGAPMNKPTATRADTAPNGPAHSCKPPQTRKQPDGQDAPMNKPTATPPHTAPNRAHSCEPPPTRKHPQSHDASMNKPTATPADTAPNRVPPQTIKQPDGQDAPMDKPTATPPDTAPNRAHPCKPHPSSPQLESHDAPADKPTTTPADQGFLLRSQQNVAKQAADAKNGRGGKKGRGARGRPRKTAQATGTKPETRKRSQAPKRASKAKANKPVKASKAQAKNKASKAGGSPAKSLAKARAVEHLDKASSSSKPKAKGATPKRKLGTSLKEDTTPPKQGQPSGAPRAKKIRCFKFSTIVPYWSRCAVGLKVAKQADAAWHRHQPYYVGVKGATMDEHLEMMYKIASGLAFWRS